MGFVDGDQGEAAFREHRKAARRQQPLGRDVKEVERGVGGARVRPPRPAPARAASSALRRAPRLGAARRPGPSSARSAARRRRRALVAATPAPDSTATCRRRSASAQRRRRRPPPARRSPVARRENRQNRRRSGALRAASPRAARLRRAASSLSRFVCRSSSPFSGSPPPVCPAACELCRPVLRRIGAQFFTASRPFSCNGNSKLVDFRLSQRSPTLRNATGVGPSETGHSSSEAACRTPQERGR